MHNPPLHANRFLVLGSPNDDIAGNEKCDEIMMALQNIKGSGLARRTHTICLTLKVDLGWSIDLDVHLELMVGESIPLGF